MASPQKGHKQYLYWRSLTASHTHVSSSNAAIPIGGCTTKRWYQQEPQQELLTPGPGSYTTGVSDTTFKRALPKPRRQQQHGTIGRGHREWRRTFSPRPDPGAYDPVPDGTFHKTWVKEPLNDLTQEEYDLRNQRMRKKHLKQMQQAESNALKASRQLSIKDELRPLRQRRVKQQMRVLRAKTADQVAERQARRARTAQDKRPAFLVKTRDRFFRPSTTADSNPGPGTHDVSESVDQFWAFNPDRAYSVPKSRRKDPASTKLYNGVAEYASYAPHVGPGSYTPDLTVPATDGLPLTSMESLTPRTTVLTQQRFMRSLRQTGGLPSRGSTRGSSRQPMAMDASIISMAASVSAPASPTRPRSPVQLMPGITMADGDFVHTSTALPMSRKQRAGPKILPGRLFMADKQLKRKQAAETQEEADAKAAIAKLEEWEARAAEAARAARSASSNKKNKK